jgi:large subunit ribosomal protein L3
MEVVNPDRGLGLIGKKIGMMRVFMHDGSAIPVTILDLSGNKIAQIKSNLVDGYTAVQLAFDKIKPSNRLKSEVGHFAKAGIDVCSFLKEFHVSPSTTIDCKLGSSLLVENLFAIGQLVDIQGISIGKGFAGTIKRHNFRSQRASHGNSRSHNVPGSISMAQDPGRVFPGKKMCGHLGNVSRTVQNLNIIRIDPNRQLLLVRGAVPGPKNGYITVRHAVKRKTKKGQFHAA